MKRDWDLIRQQLITIEDEGDVFADIPVEPKWEKQTEADYTKEYSEYQTAESRLLGHLELLTESGYIDGITIGRLLSGDYYYAVANPRLTMLGHDLLDTMRSKTIWESIKTKAKSSGIELTFDAIKALGKYALEQIIT